MLLVPLALAGVGVVAWAVWLWEAKHREALQLLARQRGWTLVERDDDAARGLPGAPFGRGSRRKAKHVLRGAWGGRSFLAFDYSYETYSTDANGNRSTQTHRFAVCALALPAAVPELELTGENALTRIGGALGLPDLELESEAFNRRYRVCADDPRFAYDVLHPRTIEALLARPTTNVRMSGYAAVSWCKGRQTPELVLATLDHLAVLVDGVPDWVWRDRSAGEAAGGWSS